MPPEDIDDLFRDQLAGHETPPGDDLWSRLNAAPMHEPAAEAADARLDQLFQKGLNVHASIPAREIWERLEDEHLRPRKRQAAAWWPMALAAALALLLVAGGAGLWLGFPFNKSVNENVASQQPTRSNPAASAGKQLNKSAISGTADAATTHATEATVAAGNAPDAPALLTKTAPLVASQKNATAQATRHAELASTAPEARISAVGQSARHLTGTNRQPDAAANHLPLVARTLPRPAPTPALLPAADEPRTVAPTASIAATAPKTIPAPEIVPATSAPTPTPSLATASTLITVEVRNGGSPANRLATTIGSAVASAEAPTERRGLGGRLLQQAGHLVRGERLSLAEATGLPENVTVRATIAGRSVSKSIQL